MPYGTVEGATSLPPQVQGVSKGLLRVSLDDIITWTASKPRPEHLFARISWWGDAPGIQTDVPLRPSGTSVSFQLRAGPAHISNYLCDMGSLDILIMQPSNASKAIGKVTLDTKAIAKAGLAPFQQALPVLGLKSGSTIGTLPLTVEIIYADGIQTPALEAAQSADRVSVPTPGSRANGPVSLGHPGTAGSTPQERIGGLSSQEPPHNTAATTRKEGSALTSRDGRCCVTVRIDSALQLPAPPNIPSDENGSPTNRFHSSSFVYVSAVWQRDRSRRVNTHLAAAQSVPAAGGHAAVWRSEVEVQVDAAAFQSAASGTLPGVLDGPLLLLNVWRSGAPTPDPGTLLEELALSSSNKRAAVATPFDRLIGCAAVDLGVLLREGQAEDRYPLVNAQHQIQGVIKACVTPNMHLAEVLNEIIRSEIYENTGTLSSGVVAAGEAATSGADEGGAKKLTSTSLYDVRGMGSPQISAPPGSGNSAPSDTLLAAKQQYAWSGSDSDGEDALGMVGVSFEGAVSCSEDEMEEEKERVQAPRAPQLITQDWMFDICRGIGEQKSSKAEEDRGAASANAHATVSGGTATKPQRGPSEASDGDKSKGIVFKNRLLPGVVMVGPDGIALEPTIAISNHSGGGGGDEHTRQAAAPAALSGPSMASSNAVRPIDTIHHSSLDGDWLFGFRKQTRQQQQPVPRPLPAGLISSQFAPMASQSPEKNQKQ